MSTAAEGVHDLWTVAYHEAGHAVVAHLLGRRLEYVTLVPGGDDDGPCCILTVDFSLPPDPVITEGQLVILMAGFAADAIARGRQCDDGCGASRGDYRRAYALLGVLNPDLAPSAELMNPYLQRAADMLTDDRVGYAVRVLGSYLAHRRRVEGEEVHGIITRALSGELAPLEDGAPA